MPRLMLHNVIYGGGGADKSDIINAFNQVFVVISGSAGLVNANHIKFVDISDALKSAGIYDDIDNYMFISAMMATNTKYVQYQPASSEPVYPYYHVVRASEPYSYAIGLYNPESSANFMRYTAIFKRLTN